MNLAPQRELLVRVFSRNNLQSFASFIRISDEVGDFSWAICHHEYTETILLPEREAEVFMKGIEERATEEDLIVDVNNTIKNGFNYHTVLGFEAKRFFKNSDCSI